MKQLGAGSSLGFVSHTEVGLQTFVYACFFLVFVYLLFFLTSTHKCEVDDARTDDEGE